MADHRTSKRYALLVGMDLCLNNGSRKLENGQSLSLNNLHSCVNDVNAPKDFLQHEYQLGNHAILTSSLPDTIGKAPMTPMESPNHLPTFTDIKWEFDAVYGRASAGDLFLFHFLGAWGTLEPSERITRWTSERPVTAHGGLLLWAACSAWVAIK